jgi:hypothetical protein
MSTIKKRPSNHDGTEVERRKSHRFPVTIPIEVSWRGSTGIARKEQAVAKNVNANGGLLEMVNYPEWGSRITLTNLLSAEAVEARVLATPNSREGVASGIVIELIIPSESFWGVNLQIKRTSAELQKLEDSLQSEGINPRLLNEFREAVNYLRTASVVVQKLREYKLHGRDEGEMYSLLVTDRIRRATNLFLEVITDLEAGRVTNETKGIDELYGALEQAHDQLSHLIKRRAPDRFVTTRF